MLSNSTNRILIILLILTLGTNVLILKDDLVQYALALNPADYNKPAGDTLTVGQWNNLDVDFVAKSGDTMTGPLTLPGPPTANLHAATKAYVDSLAAKDPMGTPYKILCGESSPAAWTNYADPDAVTTWVDTRVSGLPYFSSTPMYFTNIACTSGCWRSMGAQAVYNASNIGFRVYIQDFNPELMDSNLAQTWQYRIRWCGFGI